MFTLIGHLLNLTAMGHMPITHVMVIGLSELIFTVIVGIIAFSEIPGGFNIAGMALIVISIIVMEIFCTDPDSETC